MATSAFRIDFLLAELYFGKTFVTIPHLGGKGVNGDLTPGRWMEPRFEPFSSWNFRGESWRYRLARSPSPPSVPLMDVGFAISSPAP
jgi:hypothetical protein